MRICLVLLALCAVGCGGSSPIAPTPTPTPAPPPALRISASPCPTSVLGVDLGFYQEIGCNAFDGPMGFTRRWMVPPTIYLRTVDDGGMAVDAVTLDTVQNAMTSVSSDLTNGRFGTLRIERGTEMKAGIGGYVAVNFVKEDKGNTCGTSQVVVDGGTVTLYPMNPNCGCLGSTIGPRIAKHELGHALGYWHTDGPDDLMSILGALPCDRNLSARERQAIAYHYR